MAISDNLDPALRLDEGGVLRVGATRVTLRSVVEAFKEGASAEEIVLRYSALDLTDTYAAITYFLRNQAEVEAFFGDEDREAEQLQRWWEGRPGAAELRKRLRDAKVARKTPA